MICIKNTAMTSGGERNFVLLKCWEEIFEYHVLKKWSALKSFANDPVGLITSTRLLVNL